MRVLDLTNPRFQRALEVLGPRDSTEYQAVVRVLRELSDDAVPLVGPGDASITHGASIMGRRARGTDLVVCYIPAGPHVFLVNVLRWPLR